MNSEGRGEEQKDRQEQQKGSCFTQEKTTSNEKAELTAEWSVHAQLTISRPNIDNIGPDGGDDGSRKPVKFVYRWSSDDTKPNTTTTNTASDGQSTPVRGTGGTGGGGVGATGGIGGVSRQDDVKSESSGKVKNDSFHSNLGSGKPASDSGFSSYYNSRSCGKGTRCRSTCSIVLSAVTDFLPIGGDIPEESDQFTYNTRTSYTVSPDKAGDDLNASQNFGGTKILALRDAFSQTSDNETRFGVIGGRKEGEKYPDPTASRTSLGGFNDERDGQKRKPYDYRHITESFVSSPVDKTDEGNSKSPYYTKCPPGQQPFRSSSQSSVLQSTSHISPGQSSTTQRGGGGGGGIDPKKPPRTVHIDVYCTGSDAEDDDEEGDGDESSSPSSDNQNELESNSTPQTVLDIEQMLLRHHRANKYEVPRRLKIQQQLQQTQPYQHQQHIPPQPMIPMTARAPMEVEMGHAITKSSTADEISESKQILFKKHIGDQKAKYNLRNRWGGGYFRKDASDDCLSSNYPNSSRSTMRDLTCSSISSVVALNVNEDLESSWKETEPDGTATSLGKSDSFEYDNSVDRLRIRRMERLWSRPEKEFVEQEEYKSPASDSPTKQLNQQRRITDFLQGVRFPPQHIPSEQQYEALTPSNYHHHHMYPEMSAGNQSSIGYPMIPEKDEPPELDVSPMTTISQTNIGTPATQLYSGSYFRHGSEPRSPERPTKTLFQAEYNKSGSEASTMQSNLSGYTSEYLAKARKFGAVVTALKKPGHHIGPAKNPECQCEHCRRWMAERSEGRGRAFSMSDAFVIKQGFYLRR